MRETPTGVPSRTPGVAPSPRRARTALIVAILADAVQLGLAPFFAAGGVSPADAVLDLAIGIVMWRLVGWHFAFLPSFIAELVPGLDLFPSWTAAVWWVTRSKKPPGGDSSASVIE
jgi:hypothetical protein